MRRASVVLFVFVLGCGGEAGVPVMPPTAAGALRLRAPLPPGTDLGSLARRRIVVDPGHGGPHPGAVGKSGLTESELNLAVSLHLYGLLKQAGADVSITRWADAPSRVSGTAAVGLREDLFARVPAASDPVDLFVSIHHNASPEGAAAPDESVIYWRMLDDDEMSASELAAREVASSLGRVFRPAAVKALPGNFLVLRETDAPAILGEAFFLRSREEMLSHLWTLRLEAECYFAGIARYFSRGIPRATWAEGSDPVFESPRPTLQIALSGAAGLEVETLEAEVDGTAVPSSAITARTRFDGRGRIAVALPEDLSNADHVLRLRGRSRRSGVLYPRALSFRVDCPVATVRVEPGAEGFVTREEGGVDLAVSVRLRDASGQAVSDGRYVRVQARGLGDALVPSRGGRADHRFHAADRPARPIRVEAFCDGSRGEARVPAGSPVGPVVAGRIVGIPPRANASLARLEVWRLPNDGPDPVGQVPVRADGSFSVGPLDGPGVFTLNVEASDFFVSPVTVTATAGVINVELSSAPLPPGSLRGIRVVVTAGRSEASAPTEGLLEAVERRLAHAGVVVERASGNPVAQVRHATRWKADAYLRLRREAGSARRAAFSFHPGATEGRALAVAMASCFRDSAGAPASRAAEADFVSLHVPCAAVTLRLRGDAASAAQIADEAERIVAGLAAHRGATPPSFAPFAPAPPTPSRGCLFLP